MNLNTLKVDTKSVWIDFDDYIPGFEVEVNYIPRSEMTAIVKNCQQTKMNRKTRQVENTLDEDKFLKEFVGRAINNWKGLNTENIQKLVPVQVEGEKADVPYSEDNAIFLVKESSAFDEWVNEKVTEVETFRQ